ncbi:family 5 putative glycoside hydrolase [Podospora australis]|uniref:glucan 1,3-beta-glucosidase n=1 Tax=Podospora australis TaxID=1536484 RepID=A0AAN6WSD5_9PEZI|nr:family 5 putative glycoside hydrolase [Podospora australis]
MPRDPSSGRRERDRSERRQRSNHDRERERDRDTDAEREREERRRKRRSQQQQQQQQQQQHQSRSRPQSTSRGYGSDSAPSSSQQTQTLSAAALAQLNKANARAPKPAKRENREKSRDKERERDRDRTRERERRRERSRNAAAAAAGVGGIAAAAAGYESARERERGYESGRGFESGRAYESGRAGYESGHERGRRKGKYERLQQPDDDDDDGYAAPRIITVGRDPDEGKKKAKRRIVSGAAMEEGRASKAWRGAAAGGAIGAGAIGMGHLRGGGGGSDGSTKESDLWRGKPRPWYKQKKKLWILLGVCSVLLLIIIIVAAVVVPKAGKGNDEKRDSGSSAGDNLGSNDNLDGIDPSSIPKGAPSWLNPFVWADTKDFNLTYTTAAVADLPLMGLYLNWDDSAQANDKVPALDEPWGDYAKRPARGVNVGGWLSLEPFITPSLFNYDSRLGIVDEYSLCKYLAARCESVLENHYANFVTEQTFKEIAEAGLDHVRIPFSYWAVEVYDGDPYLFRTSWRYLLRAIEWCRRYGLRVNLDPHGIPGSQNGWNHSGRLGAIGWLKGTDGSLNAQRALDFHDRISKFFAQPRYKNIISHYGLANEPKMTELSVSAVLDWTTQAYNLVRKNGISDSIIVFGDGFRGLEKWQGDLRTLSNAALDVHQYVIFNEGQIVYNHSEKVRFVCQGWTQQTQMSMNRATGFGPTLVAEWSQADTDCAKHLTNVGAGNRWEGTLVLNGQKLDGPKCPLQDQRCSCRDANADPSKWSEPYKKFLRLFAEGQMFSFEKGWGWFYWVWDTENAAQWSYKKGMAAGVLPAKAYERSFNCDLKDIPNFSDLSEAY